MRIYTKAGDLAFTLSTFPDGQPHFKLETQDEWREATIETAIRNPAELFQVLLAKDVLGNLGYRVDLDVRYLMAARMDRAIDCRQPFTLQTVARLINGAGFSRVRILDAHSDVAPKLIRNCENLLPIEVVRQVIRTLNYPVVVCPDKGAYDRVTKLTHEVGVWAQEFIQCGKTRDPNTGKLTDFVVHDYTPERGGGTNLLIVDDICDGGGHFRWPSEGVEDSGGREGQPLRDSWYLL